MKRLTGLDATFLYMETASSHMHVASIGVFDAAGMPEPMTRDSVLRLITERLHLAPSFRQRLATIPFEIHHPIWVDDPDFDVEDHVRFTALPSPGGDRELAELAADFTSRPLDRSKPLWEMWVVEGLADGRSAVLSKTHHAAVDGVSGVDLTVALMDLQPEPVRYEPQPFVPERIPSEIERLLYGLRSRAAQPFGLVKAGRSVLRTARGIITQRRQPRSGDLAPPPAPFQAPRTSLNVAITRHRSFAFTDVSLDQVKAIKNSLGGTVNDVLLALCSGALRRYFSARGETVEEDLIAMVPISVRAEEEKGALGNKVSSMLVSLANTIDDPIARLHAISESTADAKEQHNAIGADLLQDFAEFAPPAVAVRAARLVSRVKLFDRMRPPFNITISNVPGPPFPLYSLGSKMLAAYPMGPINEGAALNITVMSYLGQLHFGFHACREAVDDVWDVAAALDDAVTELAKAAGV